MRTPVSGTPHRSAYCTRWGRAGKRLPIDAYTPHDPGPHPRPPNPPSDPCEPTGYGEPAGSTASVGVCPTPYGGPGCPAPPWGAGADIRARSGPAVVAGSRLRHILIGILSGPAPVWEGGGRRPHAGSGTTRRVLGAGRTVGEDGGSFVESGGEEGRVCSGRASRQGRGLRCGWRPVGSAALGLAGVSVRRGLTGRRVARMRGSYTCGTRTVCEGGRRFARA